MKEANLKRICTVWFQLHYFWKKQNYGDSKKISGFQELRVSMNESAEHRWFLWHYIIRQIFYDTIIVDRCIINLSKSTYVITQRVNTYHKLWTLYICKYVKVSVPQLCLTLCDPMDCSPQGSTVHGLLQKRILEWVAICRTLIWNVDILEGCSEGEGKTRYLWKLYFPVNFAVNWNLL